MARLSLNKASLARETAQLKTFRRFLPSLDLKRRQLIAQRASALAALAATRREADEYARQTGRELPMLANDGVELGDLVRLRGVELGEENAMGARLPVLRDVDVEVRDYSLLGKPHWVDRVARSAAALIELRVREQVEARRLALLDDAVQTVTQRVNLFDKVLIPRARANIKRIQIYLGDAERAAVVRAKLSKDKRAREARAREARP